MGAGAVSGVTVSGVTVSEVAQSTCRITSADIEIVDYH